MLSKFSLVDGGALFAQGRCQLSPVAGHPVSVPSIVPPPPWRFDRRVPATWWRSVDSRLSRSDADRTGTSTSHSPGAPLTHPAIGSRGEGMEVVPVGARREPPRRPGADLCWREHDMTANTKLIHAIADALIAEYDEEATEWLEDGGRANIERIVAEWRAAIEEGRWVERLEDVLVRVRAVSSFGL